MTDASTADGGGRVAIIGMSGRFPGADSIEEFWANLCAGTESIAGLSEAELLAAGADPPLLARPEYVRAKGVLRGIDLFDAGFFGFSPREAELLDPQQRLFLEVAWEALEDAGYAPGTCARPVGVYGGSGVSTYLHNLHANPDLMRMVGGMQMMIGNDKDHLPTHVSYKFDLRGPSVAVQTACSSSLVATVLASQSLLSYQCDLALAGGVLVSVPHVAGYLYQEGGVMSPDGHCRPFDAAANGTVEGNGAGVVVLKRLDEAMADGDHVYAVILGSAINNDGSVKVGYTAPGVDGQTEVIATAHAIAGVDPATITYVEAHGTATPLGDPIEIAALTRAFRASTQRTGFCAVGSVKANIGHLDPAAGVASLIKTALALEHRVVPPCVHFSEPNPQIDFATSPFYVNRTRVDWPAGPTPRRAGVSSFGIGGTNAHVVLEEPPPAAPSPAARPDQLYVLSARSAAALDAATARLGEHLRRHPELDPADVAHTLQVGRKAFGHRRALVAPDLAGAARMLEERRGAIATAPRDAREPSVAFMFPGGGAAYEWMGRDLYRSEPVFREHLDRCCERLRPELGRDPRHSLYPEHSVAGDHPPDLMSPAIGLSALFAFEYALAQLWLSWGVRPRVLIGHSFGEYVAAAVAGVLSLDDALQLAVLRGRLFEQLPAGAMLGVALDPASLRDMIDERLSIAAINAPNQCVVAGPDDAIAALAARLVEQGIGCHRLKFEAAAHCPLVEAVLPSFRAGLDRVRFGPASIPIVSTLTGTWARGEDVADTAYWTRQLREPVRFADAVGCLLGEAGWILLEVGPGRTLSTLARQHPLCRPDQVVLSSTRHPHERASDTAFALNTLGQLWLAGTPIDWAALHAGERRHRASLPTYPFERRRFWIDPPRRHAGRARTGVSNGRTERDEWLYVPGWRRTPPAIPAERSTGTHERWLVFTDESGLGRALGQRLAGAGDGVVYVTAGDAFVRHGPDDYTLTPGRREHHHALLAELRSQGRLPSGVLHLWSVAPAGPLTRATVTHDLDRGFYSLVALAQAYGDERLGMPQQLVVVSSGVHDVTGDEVLSPQRATVLAACTVLPQEYPGSICRAVDVDAPEPGAPDGALADRLFAEVTGGSGERVVAYRRRHRWAQTFEPLPAREDPSGSPALRDGGVYVITGGLGKIGLTLAAHLARAARAKLVLVSRTPLPPRAEWSRWLDGSGPGLGSTLRRLHALEVDGAEVVVACADVENRGQMRTLVDDVVRRFGAIHGVIHAAGVTDEGGFGPIHAIDRAACERQFGPKVYGSLILDEVLQDRDVDWVLLCSSLSTVLGGLGFIAYAAANLFLDALARRHGQTARSRWRSVDWEGWRFDDGAAHDGSGGSVLDLALSPPEGVEVFRRILAAPPVPQVLVSTADLPARIDRWVAADGPAGHHRAAPDPRVPLHPRPELSAARVAPRTEPERLIAKIWENMLGISEIGVEDDFFELGGDSLLAIQLMARVCTTCGVKIPLHRLFEAPTVAGLAVVVEDAVLAEVETLSDVDAERLLDEGG